MRKVIASACAAAVLVVLFASAQGTSAFWRASGEISPGTIMTGSLSLQVGNEGTFATDYAFKTLDASNLAPGGFVQAPLTISNAGSVGLRYALFGAVSTTPTLGEPDAKLAAAVELSVYAGVVPANCSARILPPGNPVYKGPLSDAAAFAQPRDLATSGDGVAQETLCVRVTLPADAPQNASGGKLTLTLSWRGDQL